MFHLFLCRYQALQKFDSETTKMQYFRSAHISPHPSPNPLYSIVPTHSDVATAPNFHLAGREERQIDIFSSRYHNIDANITVVS